MRTDSKMRKKAWILLILVLAAMLIPMKNQYRDGGTLEYKAIVYQVIKLNRMTTQDNRLGTLTGTKIRIFGFQVYDSVAFVPNNMDTILSPAE